MGKGLSEKMTEEIRAIAAERSCRLLAVETAGAGRFTVLRVVLERANGESVTVEDCEGVSREISTILDAAEEGPPHRYTLEVSSAGLERKLYSLEDAERFVGKRVRVKTEIPVQPLAAGTGEPAPGLPSKNLRGLLQSVDGDLLTVVDEENRKIYNVRFGEIRQARLDFEWPARGGSR